LRTSFQPGAVQSVDLQAIAGCDALIHIYSETRAFFTGFEERLDAKLAGLEERTYAKFVALQARLPTRIEESQEALASIVAGQFEAVRRIDGLKGAFEVLEDRVGALAVAVNSQAHR
jgi:hypothetical protein